MVRVFAASESIGSIENPIPFKVGGDPITYKYTYSSTEGTTTKTLSLSLLDQKKGAEAEEFVHANRENCLKSTSNSCWYLYKIRRRLEILNIDDEYSTRRDSAKILFKTLAFDIGANKTIKITHIMN